MGKWSNGWSTLLISSIGPDHAVFDKSGPFAERSGLPQFGMMKAALFIRSFVSAILMIGLQAKTETSGAKRETIRLTYLGNAGYQIDDGKTVLLVDPYLTQFKPGGMGPTDLNDKSDPLLDPDAAEIDKHVSRADYILITHSHSDHLLDAPYIATKTKAVIIGTDGTARLARVRGVPNDQTIVVKGGEDYDFSSFSLRVIPSLHSPLLKKRYNNYSFAGVVPKNLKAPLHESVYAEGGTVIYLLIGGHEILIMGSMNYIEREVTLTGLRPDIALVGSGPSRKELTDYTGRLMRALNCPAKVLLTHWDSLGSMNARAGREGRAGVRHGSEGSMPTHGRNHSRLL
jgi:L-ascorbate metabolism protein UlaG (beta-lactamase superfamily)